MKKVPAEEIKNRLDKILKIMDEKHVDLSIIVQNIDRYYFTGTMQNGILLISRDKGPKLFIRRTLETALEESDLEDITLYSGTKTILEYIKNNRIKVERLGLEMDVLPAFLYSKFKELFSEAEIFDISLDIKRVRMLKSSYEINLLKEAANRVDQVMMRMKNLIRPGIMEKDLVPEYLKLIAEKDSSPCVRTRQYNMESMQKYILSGRSVSRQSYLDSPSSGGIGITSAYPGGAGDNKIMPGVPILIDLVMNYEGYNADCTRIFAISDIAEKFVKAHKISKKCHKVFREMAGNGKNVQDITKEIRAIVKDNGLEKQFMGGVKFIGHGIGLELDEIPVITDKFDKNIESGMIIAFEPKFIFEDGASGYETTYLINDGNTETLNKIQEDIILILN